MNLICPPCQTFGLNEVLLAASPLPNKPQTGNPENSRSSEADQTKAEEGFRCRPNRSSESEIPDINDDAHDPENAGDANDHDVHEL